MAVSARLIFENWIASQNTKLA